MASKMAIAVWTGAGVVALALAGVVLLGGQEEGPAVVSGGQSSQAASTPTSPSESESPDGSPAASSSATPSASANPGESSSPTSTQSSNAESQGPKAEVPDVVSLSVTEAVQVLTKAGFKVSELNWVGSDEGLYGHISTTSPSAGEQVSKGSVIEVFTPLPAATATMPNLANLTWEEARAKLDKSGIAVVAFGILDINTPVPSPDTTLPTPPAGEEGLAGKPPKVSEVERVPGTVAGSFPEAGTKVSPGDAVVITFFSGGRAKVPEVTGLPVSTAYTMTVQAGLSPEIEDPSGTWNNKAPWLVTSSTAVPGTAVELGSIATLTIQP